MLTSGEHFLFQRVFLRSPKGSRFCCAKTRKTRATLVELARNARVFAAQKTVKTLLGSGLRLARDGIVIARSRAMWQSIICGGNGTI